MESADKIFFEWDENFRPENTSAYSLIFEVEKKSCRFSLLEIDKNRFIGLGDFRRSFEDVVNSVKWLTNSFHSTRIIIANSLSTLIPTALFSKEDSSLYLDFNFEKYDQDTIFNDELRNLQINSVYCIPGDLHKKIISYFPDAKVSHISTILIECLFANFKNLFGQGKVFLNVRNGEFDLIIFKVKGLQYFNSFQFKAPEDLLYYLIFVMEQLNLNPEETPLVLLGDTDKKSEIFELIFRYVRNVEFVDRNETSGYSYVLNEIPSHKYYSLFNSGQ